jgi:predicted nucleic acid-binding protein
VLESASTICSSRLVYVEGRAALAAARRARRLRGRRWNGVRRSLEEIAERIDFLEFRAGLAAFAGDVGERHRLRSGDAVHLASALVLGDRELVVASWDGDLRRAALDAGLAVFPARVP